MQTCMWTLVVLGAPSLFAAVPVASHLRAEARPGQVFLTWDEAAGWQGTLTVLGSAQPITADNVRQATVVAHHLNPGTAYDWWLDPETYGAPLEPDPATGRKPPVPHEGFLLAAGAAKLNPDSGLHVHTVGPDEAGARYYAVVGTAADGTADWTVVPGANALAEPVQQRPAPAQPIWQGPGAAPDPAATRGLPVHLVLHAKRGKGGQSFLAFGDAGLGWREGLPFKFGVAVQKDAVVITPTDRTWIGRRFPEGKDECQRLTPAIHSFWYGYNDRIYDPAQMPAGTVVNYTERRLLWILDWVRQTYGTDPNRVYATGSSMGGCGAISFCLRHPEVFAAVAAHVPIVAYGKGPGGDSTVRVVAETGGLDMPSSEGLPLGQRLDGTRFVREHPDDLPFLVIANGRQDGSIPWGRNPDFYRALRDGRHGFVAAWNDGTHATCGNELPADIRAWADVARFHDRLALNRSFPAFSHSSRDDDPGNGDPKDGARVGFLNRGLTWDAPVDRADRYEVVIRWALEETQLPVTVDVTLRRPQAFRPRPGQSLTARNRTADSGQEVQQLSVTVDAQGRVTVPGFRLTSAAGHRLVVEPVP